MPKLRERKAGMAVRMELEARAGCPNLLDSGRNARWTPRMNRRPDFRIPAGNPIVNGLMILAGVAVIAASVVIGFFAILVLGSAFLILAAIVGIRLWWFRWKLRRSGGPGQDREPTGDASMIEGEYTVIVTERRDREGPEA